MIYICEYILYLKERERMAKVNEAFERLREVMPDLSLILQDEKDTKVG